MPQLSELTDAPTTVDDNELFYVRLPAGSSVNRKRRAATLVAYILGNSASALRGFFGASPIAQPAHADQAFVTATVGSAVATTAATNTTPFGFTTAQQANDLVTRVNQLRADVQALTKLCNAQREALVSLGLIKGSA